MSGIESRGAEMLRGTGTERYRVQFDAPAAEGRVPAHLLAEMYRRGESPGKGYLDLWLEGDRLRQFTSVTNPSDDSAIPLRFEQEYGTTTRCHRSGSPTGYRRGGLAEAPGRLTG